MNDTRLNAVKQAF